jgi:hypothetical protein
MPKISVAQADVKKEGGGVSKENTALPEKKDSGTLAGWSLQKFGRI